MIENKSGLSVGDSIEFGKDIWRILDIQDDMAFLLMEYAVMSMIPGIIKTAPYHDDHGPVTWETCSLRKYLNGKFLKKFTMEQQERIVEMKVYTPDNLWYGTPGGNDTYDKIFLPCIEDMENYFGGGNSYRERDRKGWDHINRKFYTDRNGGYFSDSHDSARVAQSKGGGLVWWWLRSPGVDDRHVAVIQTGDVFVHGFYASDKEGGIRPALWLYI